MDCAVERTFPATLSIGGTSGSDESTHVGLDYDDRDVNDACLVANLTASDAPFVFSRADLFDRKKKRLSDRGLGLLQRARERHRDQRRRAHR